MAIGYRNRRRRSHRNAAVLLSLSTLAATIGITSASEASASPSTITLVVSDYMFDSTPLTVMYGKELTKEWDAKFPNVKLKVIEIAGTDVDEADALALQFKEASTTPDVITTETPYLSEYADAGYLDTLNHDLSPSNAPAFWKQMPTSIQQLTTFGNDIYGVAPGVNDQGILQQGHPQEGRDPRALESQELGRHPQRCEADQGEGPWRSTHVARRWS